MERPRRTGSPGPVYADPANYVPVDPAAIGFFP